MYRNFLIGLCAVALVTVGLSAVQAQTVSLSLNLRYTDPADPSEGGTWELVGKVDSGLGISAVNAILSDVDNGIAPDDIDLGPNNGAIDPVDVGGTPRPAYLAFGTVTDLIYGQDITSGAVANVGLPASLSNIPVDVLRNVALWNDASLLASGDFSTAIRPDFTTNGTSSTDANVFSSVTAPIGAVAATAVTTTVRGDSLETLLLENTAGTGLLPGDVNRDGFVNGSDFALLGGSWQSAVPSITAWNSGDLNDSDFVDGSDFALLGGSWQGASTPPALSGGVVPEPSTLLLASAALLFGFCRRRTRCI